MTIQELVTKAHLALKDQDLSPAGDKLAVQINVTGKDAGVFYIEILNGRLSVEPYEYIDRNCSITMASSDLSRFIAGRLNAVTALASGKIKVEGDLGKAKVLADLLKAAAPKIEKKPAPAKAAAPVKEAAPVVKEAPAKAAATTSTKTTSTAKASSCKKTSAKKSK